MASVMLEPMTKNILARENSEKELVIAPGPERCRQPGDCWGMSSTGTMVDVVGLEHPPEQLLHLYESSLMLRAQLTPATPSGPFSAIICLNLLATRSRAHPRSLAEGVSFPNQGGCQAFLRVNEIIAKATLDAQPPLVGRAFLHTGNFDYFAHL